MLFYWCDSLLSHPTVIIPHSACLSGWLLIVEMMLPIFIHLDFKKWIPLTSWAFVVSSFQGGPPGRSKVFSNSGVFSLSIFYNSGLFFFSFSSNSESSVLQSGSSAPLNTSWSSPCLYKPHLASVSKTHVLSWEPWGRLCQHRWELCVFGELRCTSYLVNLI